MDNSILPISCACLKSDYSTAHEFLCTKLQQAYTIAEVLATNGELTAGQINRLSWNLADLIKAASEQCEKLTPGDFDPVE